MKRSKSLKNTIPELTPSDTRMLSQIDAIEWPEFHPEDLEPLIVAMEAALTTGVYPKSSLAGSIEQGRVHNELSRGKTHTTETKGAKSGKRR